MKRLMLLWPLLLGLAQAQPPLNQTIVQCTANCGLSTGGGTSTPGINTTGAQLLTAECYAYYFTYTNYPTFSDSSSNVWVSAGKCTDVNAVQSVELFYVTHPTTSASQTFTVGGQLSGCMVQAWSPSTTNGVLDSGVFSCGGTLANGYYDPGSVTPNFAYDLLVTGLTMVTNSNVSLNPPASFTALTPVPYVGSFNEPGFASFYIDPSTSPIDPIWQYIGGVVANQVAIMAGFKTGSSVETQIGAFIAGP